MPKLTETFARKTPFAVSGTKKLWDAEIKGLVLFVGKQSKTWYFQKDVGGQTKRFLIGRHPIVSSDAARQTAMKFSLDLARGAGKRIQIGAPRLEDAMEAYLSRPKLRSETYKSGVRQQFERHLKDWLRLPLSEISKAMVAERHRKMASIPSGANHVLRQFRSVWNHARRTHDLPETPTIAIEWYSEVAEADVIEDLQGWQRTIDGLENPIHAAFFRFLLFTGFRKSEATTLEWKNVHEDRIHLPMTKNGRSFDLPIIEVHREILEPMRRLDRHWVFPSPKSNSGHLTNPARLQWSRHAHRRTFASVAMEAGVLEEIVGRLLNHTPISITGRRYARPSLDALRPAMSATCDEISKRTVIS